MSDCDCECKASYVVIIDVVWSVKTKASGKNSVKKFPEKKFGKKIWKISKIGTVTLVGTLLGQYWVV